MVRRNIDLELQALTLIKKQMGHSLQAYDKETSESSSYNTTQKRRAEEDKMLEEAVKLSEEQYKLECSLDEEELRRLIDQAKAESLKLYTQQQQQLKQTTEGERTEEEMGPSESLQENREGHANSLEGSKNMVREREGENSLGVRVEESVTKQEREDETVSAKLPLVELTRSPHPSSPTEVQSEKKASEAHVKLGNSGEAMAEWLEAARAGVDSGSEGTKWSPHTQSTAVRL